MDSVPLPKGYAGVDDLPKQREHLINLMPVDNGVVRTPGLESVISAAGDGCRGAATWEVDEKPYFVQGTTLNRLESGGTVTDLGTIAGTADVIFSKGQIYLIILVRGGSAYSYDTSNGLQNISDPDYVPCQSVAFINGRHVFIPSDGNPAIYTHIEDALANEATIDGFIDAQQLPDRNRHCINLRNKLVIFGAGSGETFSLGGELNLPFIPMTGTRMETGYVSAGSKYKNTYVFIGRDEDQSYGIYMIVGHGQTQLIANAVVMEDLNDLTSTEIEAARANRFVWFNKEIIVFTIGNRSFGFVEGSWVFFDSDLNGTEEGPWRVNGITFAYGKYYVGDSETNNIGTLSDVSTEYSGDFEYQLQTFYRSERDANFQIAQIELDVLTGQGDTTLGVALSRDGRLWSDYSYRSLGPAGNYAKRVRWAPSGGCGYYETFMGLKVRGTGAVKFSAEALYVS